jgi:hypothetical protein
MLTPGARRVKAMYNNDRTKSSKEKKIGFVTFTQIMSIMGDRNSKKSERVLRNAILKTGSEVRELRDEIYLLIVKQLVNNPSAMSYHKGLSLLSVVAYTFLPEEDSTSRDFKWWLETEKKRLQEADESEQSQLHSRNIDFILTNFSEHFALGMSRTTVPSFAEQQKLKNFTHPSTTMTSDSAGN